jgi:hypothetical protein
VKHISKLYNEELHNLYTSPNITVNKSRRMRLVRHVTYMVEMRNAYKILVGNHEGKRSLRRSRHRWKDNIRMDLREIEWELWWALVSTAMYVS